jgi:hypothetical protein
VARYELPIAAPPLFRRASATTGYSGKSPVGGVASMQGDLHMSAAAAARIASTAEGITPLVLNELRIVLDEVSRQRALG